MGFSVLLNDPGLSHEQRREYISIIMSNSDSLLFLIEDILDFSMIEANQLKIHNSKFSLNELITNIYSSFSLRNNTPQLEIKLSNKVVEKYYTLNSDEHRIRQIISNLMSNAIKFTKKGIIEILVETSNNNLIISVKDTGNGISKDQQERIFDQFVKLENDQFMAKRGISYNFV